MSVKNKRILITAGPTWVPIDSVRVISNTATGRTGILLAEKLVRLGAKVTLVLGPVEYCCINNRIKAMRFKFFDQLYAIIKKELSAKNYDIVIHSAAVSDYRPKIISRGKIKSGKKTWILNLVPTPKIINLIKKINHSVFLVGFKFEPHSSRGRLIKQARMIFKHTRADLVVANTVYNSDYRAYILSPKAVSGRILSRAKLAQNLIQEIRETLWQN